MTLFVRTNKHTRRRFTWEKAIAGARSIEPPHYSMLEKEAQAFAQMQRDKLSSLDFDNKNAVLSIELQA